MEKMNITKKEHKRLRWYGDPNQSWLRVPLDMIWRLGIAEQIEESVFTTIGGKYAHLVCGKSHEAFKKAAGYDSVPEGADLWNSIPISYSRSVRRCSDPAFTPERFYKAVSRIDGGPYFAGRENECTPKRTVVHEIWCADGRLCVWLVSEIDPADPERAYGWMHLETGEPKWGVFRLDEIRKLGAVRFYAADKNMFESIVGCAEEFRKINGHTAAVT